MQMIDNNDNDIRLTEDRSAPPPFAQAPIEPSASQQPILSDFELRAAYVLAASKSRKEACDRLGCSYAWLYNLERKSPEFRLAKAQATREIIERISDTAADFGEMFDGEIARSFATLVEVRDDITEAGKTRIRSALGILDRAPNAPKAVRESKSENKTIIQLPVQHLKALEMAASDIQDAEIVEMLASGREENVESDHLEKADGNAPSGPIDDYVPNVINVDEL